MNIPIPANRLELLSVFAEVGRQFDQARAEIHTREGIINEGVAQLEAIPASLDLDATGLSETHPLREMTQTCIDDIKVVFGKWLSRVKDHERRTDFSKRYGDSLLIFVFGKVKAGKSSLGNYIAYGTSTPLPDTILQADPKPAFFWEDGTNANESMSADKMAQQMCFGVGINETTSSIQGFTLPGLTWVDTPGVHSINEVNGELAGRYVDAADLVLFLSNSSSPGRRSDLEEIAGLLKRRKSLLVLLTASDLIDEDVDDEGRVIKTRKMKSDEDRRGQHSYVKSQLDGLDETCRARLGDVRIHSLSVSYAEEGEDEKDEQRWRDSGMAGFAADIAKITRLNGMTLKRQTPLKNLSAFCVFTRGAIDGIETALRDFGISLAAAKETLGRECDSALGSIRRDMLTQIDSLVDRYAEMKDDKGFSQACAAVFDEIFLTHAAEICRKVAKQFDAATSRLHNVVGEASPAPGFAERRRTVEYASRKGERIGHAVGAGLGATGAYIGTMIFPGLGTAVGLGVGLLAGKIGGKIGKAVGQRFDGPEEIDVVTGDNRQEVSVAVRDYFWKLAQSRMGTLREQLEQNCFGGIECELKKISDELIVFRQKLDAQIHEISEELDHAAT